MIDGVEARPREHLPRLPPWWPSRRRWSGLNEGRRGAVGTHEQGSRAQSGVRSLRRPRLVLAGGPFVCGICGSEFAPDDEGPMSQPSTVWRRCGGRLLGPAGGSYSSTRRVKNVQDLRCIYCRGGRTNRDSCIDPSVHIVGITVIRSDIHGAYRRLCCVNLNWAVSVGAVGAVGDAIDEIEGSGRSRLIGTDK